MLSKHHLHPPNPRYDVGQQFGGIQCCTKGVLQLASMSVSREATALFTLMAVYGAGVLPKALL